MNEWVLKSRDLARKSGYLDKLLDVYPVETNPPRPISKVVLDNLETLLRTGDDFELVKACLPLDRFPVDDQYVAFFGYFEGGIDGNPQTVHRIAERIRQLGFEQLKARITVPIQPSRQTGPRFSTWISNLGFPMLDEQALVAHEEGIAFLSGGDEARGDFANTYLGARLSKGLDCIAKKNRSYVIVEAKFISDVGGSQRNQFDSAVDMARSKEGEATRVAVLDGVVWVLGGGQYMYRRLDATNVLAMSGLLFLEYLKGLR